MEFNVLNLNKKYKKYIINKELNKVKPYLTFEQIDINAFKCTRCPEIETCEYAFLKGNTINKCLMEFNMEQNFKIVKVEQGSNREVAFNLTELNAKKICDAMNKERAKVEYFAVPMEPNDNN